VRNDGRFERLGLRRVLELRRHDGSFKMRETVKMAKETKRTANE